MADGKSAQSVRRRGDRIRRRELMLLLGGAITASRAVCSQQNAMPVVGFLGSSSPETSAAFVAAFRQGLRIPAMLTDKT
jgi:putative ABC transport system substrate-binding protein